MIPTPVQIRDKLLKQLDDKNNVDEAVVVEMVSILENCQITRATLEETRIGKVVNDLRRKIKNEKLAKQLKQLVRNWKAILDQAIVANGVFKPVQDVKLQPNHAVSPSLSSLSCTNDQIFSAQSGCKAKTPVLVGKKSSLVADTRGVSPRTCERQRLCAVQETTSSRISSMTSHLGSVTVPGLAASELVPSLVASPLLSGHLSSPAVSTRVASPAVTGHACTASSSVSGCVTSLNRSECVVSPLGTGRLMSPLVHGHEVSPGDSSQTVSAAQRLRKRQGPKVSAPLNRSPALQRGSDSEISVNASSGGLAKRRKTTVGENSQFGGRLTTISLHNERSLDRLNGRADSAKLDSEDESTCSSSRNNQFSSACPLSHSVSNPVSTLNNKNGIKDQTKLLETNIANRKRVCEQLELPTIAKKRQKLDSSDVSAVGSSRSGNLNNGQMAKCDILQNIRSPACNPSSSLTHSSSLLLNGESDRFVSDVHSDLLSFQESSGSLFSIQSFDKTLGEKHKVKTTEQLIDELQKKSSNTKVGDDIMVKLRTNQIVKEEDHLESILPAGVKPRGKRDQHKHNISVPVLSSDEMLSQVKNELLERFLKTSEPSLHEYGYDPFKYDQLNSSVPSMLEPSLHLGECSSSFSKDSFDVSFSGTRQDHPDSAPSSIDAVSPPFPSTSQGERTGSALTLEEIYRQLPPVDCDVDWDAVEFFELPEPTVVTEKLVDRLHSEHLPGINGLYDINRDWTSWQQTITLSSFEGDLLHILPYVDLDN